MAALAATADKAAGGFKRVGRGHGADLASQNLVVT